MLFQRQVCVLPKRAGHSVFNGLPKQVLGSERGAVTLPGHTARPPSLPSNWLSSKPRLVGGLNSQGHRSKWTAGLGWRGMGVLKSDKSGPLPLPATLEGGQGADKTPACPTQPTQHLSPGGGASRPLLQGTEMVRREGHPSKANTAGRMHSIPRPG